MMMEGVDDLAKSIVQLNTFEDASQILVKYYGKLERRNRDLEKRLSEFKSQLCMVRDAYEAKASAVTTSQIKIKDLEVENEILKRGGNFATVLLDGDGCIWSKDRLLQGMEGGKIAATDLRAAIENENVKLGLELSQTIVTLFLNKRGLLGVLKENGISYEVAEQFLTGLNLADPLITCVDCAQVKEGVDEKLKAYARLYANLPQCKQIYLGVSHDKSYASTLEMFKTRGLDHKVRLIQSHDFIPKDLRVLSAIPLHVEGLFIKEKLFNRSTLSEHSAPFIPSAPMAVNIPPPPRRSSTSSPTQAVVQTNVSPSSSPVKESLTKNWISFSAAAAALKRRKSSTSSHGSESAAAAATNKIVAGETKVLRSKSFWKDGAKLPTEEVAEIKEIYKKRPCHYFYLRRDGCCSGDACTYSHHIDMTKEQLLLMRSGAKTQPCYDEQKAGCNEVDCFRGHSCPFGGQCTNVSCKFRSTPGMHPDQPTDSTSTTITTNQQQQQHVQELYIWRRDRDQKNLVTNGGMLNQNEGIESWQQLPSSQVQQQLTSMTHDDLMFPPLENNVVVTSSIKPIAGRCTIKSR